MFTVILTWVIYSNETVYFETSPVELVCKTYGMNPFPESIPIAGFIASHSNPNDKIQILGSEPQIYFYSNRLSASGHIYMFGLMELQKYSIDMQKELIKDVENAKPKYIISVEIPTSWLGKQYSGKIIFKWAEKYIPENYNLVGLVDKLSETDVRYKYYDELKNYTCQSAFNIGIYERK
jgi:hypothetical protein